MALTVCLKCDKCYGETKDTCPYCGTRNFFCDDQTVVQAVDVLIEDMERKEKLKELERVRNSLISQTIPEDFLPFAEEIKLEKS